jgi:2-dehydropantoate 2-reductase
VTGAAKILILGAGAVGLSLAAKLSGVCEVLAVTREPYARAVTSEGLILTGAWGSGTFWFPCSATVPEDSVFDYILITSKSHDTDTICRQYASTLHNRPVVSLQNGLGNEQLIAHYTDRVIGGVVLTGFVRTGVREINVTANAGPLQIGLFPEGVDDNLCRLAVLMEKAGIPAEATDRIQGHIWSKNLINCCLNPLSALMEVPYGLLREPEAWGIIDQITREIFTLAEREGIILPWGNPECYLAYLHGTLIPMMAKHRSSMLQDFQHGHATEIDYLNGAIVTCAHRHNMPAPVNACLSDLIRFRERLAGIRKRSTNPEK